MTQHVDLSRYARFIQSKRAKITVRSFISLTTLIKLIQFDEHHRQILKQEEALGVISHELYLIQKHLAFLSSLHLRILQLEMKCGSNTLNCTLNLILKLLTLSFYIHIIRKNYEHFNLLCTTGYSMTCIS
jgi:hypothetical protein